MGKKKDQAILQFDSQDSNDPLLNSSFGGGNDSSSTGSGIRKSTITSPSRTPKRSRLTPRSPSSSVRSLNSTNSSSSKSAKKLISRLFCSSSKHRDFGAIGEHNPHRHHNSAPHHLLPCESEITYSPNSSPGRGTRTSNTTNFDTERVTVVSSGATTSTFSGCSDFEEEKSEKLVFANQQKLSPSNAVQGVIQFDPTSEVPVHRNMAPIAGNCASSDAIGGMDSSHSDSKMDTVVFQDIVQTSPDTQAEIFMEESTSSTENSPKRHTPSSRTMKTPGASIPTPQTQFVENERTQKVLFPHPLPDNASNVASPRIDDESEVDDDAFLPDDFDKSEPMFTREQLKKQVHESESIIRKAMEEEHERTVSEMHQQALDMLKEHGEKWKDDAEAEYERMQNLLKQEKSKTQQQQHSLINKTSEIAQLRETLQEALKEKGDHATRIATLEAQLRSYEGKQAGATSQVTVGTGPSNQDVQALQEQLALMTKERDELKAAQTDSVEAQETISSLRREVDSLHFQMQEMRIDADLASVLSNEVDHASMENVQRMHQEELRQLQAGKDEASRQVVMLTERLHQLLEQGTDNILKEAMRKLKDERDGLERQLLALKRKDRQPSSPTTPNQHQIKSALSQVATLQEQFNKLSVGPDNDAARKNANSTIQSLHENLKSISEISSNDDLQKQQHEEEIKRVRMEERAAAEKTIQGLKKQIDSSGQVSPTKTSNDKLEKEVIALKEQIEQMRQKSEAELQDHYVKAATERDELESKMTDMELRHAEDLELIQKASQSDLERSRRSDREKLDAIQVKADMEKIELQAQIESLKESHQAELERVRNQTLEKVKIEFEDEKIEIIETKEQEFHRLEARIEQMEKEHEEQIKSVRKQAADELEESINRMRKEKLQSLEKSQQTCDEMEQQMEKIRKELSEKVEAAKTSAGLELRIKELTTQHHEELKASKTESEKEIEELRIQQAESKLAARDEKNRLLEKINKLESKIQVLRETREVELESARIEARNSMKEDLNALERQIESMSCDDSEIMKKLQDMEAKMATDRKAYEQQVRDLRTEHGKEIEEMLSQLDLVEAEHNQQCAEKDRVVKEKEAVISALGTQLADVQSRLNMMAEQQETQAKELEAAWNDARLAADEIGSLKSEIDRLTLEYKRSKEAEVLLREQACEAAREEMIERAEAQFEQANETYKQLKHEYDGAIARISGLEKQVTEAKDAASEAKKKQEQSAVDYADELAQVKASIATIEANAARKVRQYSLEADKYKEADAELRRQLEEAQSTSRTVQTTLATVVAEKERMIEENNELKNVCEELMAMVEGQQQQA